MFPALLVAFGLAGCAATGQPAAEQHALDQVRATIGQTGDVSKDGVLTFDLVRSDLHTRLKGLDVNPALTMDGSVSFRVLPNGQVLSTAELPALRDEVDPAADALRRGGILVSAVHNHHLYDDPPDIYVHGEVAGDPATVAAAVRQALDAIHDPQRTTPAQPVKGLDTKRIDAIIGNKGKAKHGIYVVSVDARPDTMLQHQNAPAGLGFEHEFRFEPMDGGQAVVMAEFVLLAGQVTPVFDILRENGFTVSALHNHFLTDQPHRLFLHASMSGDAVRAAEVIRRALKASGS